MKYRSLVWVGGIASIFLFLPSLAVKLWELFLRSSWQFKSILLYGVTGVLLIAFIRRRLIWKRATSKIANETTPLAIVQRRLAEGSISLEEYRQIKEELM